MEIVNKKIGEVIPYKYNPRENDKAVPYVMNSIKEFGFKVPIVIDKNNVVVAGHTRLKAAERLGLEEVPCIVADDLTDEQIKAFRLADNKVSEQADWDIDLLNIELDDIGINMEQFGFEDLKISLDEDEEEITPEIEFTEVLGEEHNYIVLYFDNEVDWLQAESLFDLKTVKNLSTRKDGKISKGMETTGIGRVIKGREAIDKILGDRR